MSNRFIQCFGCAFAMLAASVVVASDDVVRGLQPSDFYKEVLVTDAAVSPDGALLAFVVMRVDEEKNSRRQELWMQALRRGKPEGEPYRFSNPTVSASSPKWSPDGNILSFSSKRGDDDNTTWFIRVTAPGGEAYHIEGVEGSPEWSPDGQWIAFVKSPDDDDEKKDSEEKSGEAKEDEDNEDKGEKKKSDAPKERKGWVSPDAITDTVDAKRFDGRVYTTMQMKRDGSLTFQAHVSARNKRQLWVVSAEGGEAVQVTETAFDVSSPEWTADSAHLIFSGDPLQDDEYNDDLTSDLFVVSRDGGEPTALTVNPGNDSSPAVSPDGGMLVWLRTEDRGEQTDVMAVPLSPGGSFKNAEPENLTADWDYGPGGPEWVGGSRRVRWESSHHGNRHVFESDLRGRVRQVTEGDRTLGDVSYDDDAKVMAYTVTDPLRPGDLFIAKADGSSEERVTSFNDEWLAEVTLTAPRRLTWTVDSGEEVEGWLIPPVGHEPGTKAPMILKIHGGPHSAYGNYWFRTFHVLADAGFYVLYPNPRGSAGYGHDFTYATRGKWGLLDSEDYLKGVDAAIAAEPDIDADRVGVSGGSYGGFMTAWLTSTTGRFAAANPSRMISNWESWYGVSDAQGLTEFEFDGKPWEVRELYRQLSPLSYVENVVAPTLIIHSENDYRTPIADGEQWYMALKKRSVPVELVRYPRSSHGLSRTGEPWLLVDRLERIKTWFTHWLIEEKLTNTEAKARFGGE